MTLNGVANPVVRANVLGKQLILTLDTPAHAGDVLTFSYAKPAANPVQDTGGNQAASLGVQTLNVTARAASVEITSNPGGVDNKYGAGRGDPGVV